MGSASYRSFCVQVKVGFRIAGWPFGRLDIGDEELRVRTWLLPSVRRHSVRKEAVTKIYSYQRAGRHRLKFEDTGGAFAKVSVSLLTGRRAIVEELRYRGYPVIQQSPPLFGFRRLSLQPGQVTARWPGPDQMRWACA